MSDGTPKKPAKGPGTPTVMVSTTNTNNGSSGEGGSSNPSTPPIVRSATPNAMMASSMSTPMVAGASATPAPTPSTASKQEYKAQRKTYRKEKKRLAGELTSALRDPSIIIMHDWLKVRGTLKGWTKLWCVLKPGHLLIYKTPKTKSSGWIGTVYLTSCEIIERPSKKEGFCFKIFNPMEQTIWASRGPEGETMGAVCQPLPTSYLIFRAASLADGKCWMDALELALRCSSLLKRSMSSQPPSTGTPVRIGAGGDEQLRFLTPGASSLQGGSSSNGHESSDGGVTDGGGGERVGLPPPVFSHQQAADVMSKLDTAQLELLIRENEAAKRYMEAESHTEEEEYDGEDEFADDTDEDDENLVGDTHSESDSDSVNPHDSRSSGNENTDNPPPECDHYAAREVEEGEFGSTGGAGQTEELAEENRSLLWFLLKQVRPGMDLSKVVLPTFILEPRSFLDKLSDYYYHADMLSQVVKEEDPFLRMKCMVRYYLSGFYKKPKGLKKPYNPLIGETFRCAWQHPNGSRTFYVAEQVSHHPPVSAIYVTNRVDGFTVNATVTARSKFYGNSTSAVLEGCARLTLLPRREEYVMTMPYAHCKGILMGTLSMELGGKVTINCETTGYNTELDFKLKPFLGGYDAVNMVTGKIKIGKDTVATLEGHWDGVIQFVDKRTQTKEVLWNPTPEIRAKRLSRMTVPMEKQGPWESERLWQHVTQSIRTGDQMAATEEKTKLEELQRNMTKERKEKGEDWDPKYFERSVHSGEWTYKYIDQRPWDKSNDQFQYENDYIILTHSKHRAPLVKMASMSMQHLDSPDTVHAKNNQKRRSRKKRCTDSTSEAAEKPQVSKSNPDAQRGQAATQSHQTNADEKKGLRESPKKSLKVADIAPSEKTTVQEIGRLSVQVLRLEEKVDELRDQHQTAFWRHAFLFVFFGLFQAILLKWFLKQQKA